MGRLIRRGLTHLSGLKRTFLLLSLLICASLTNEHLCAAPDTSGVVQLVGRFAAGHACPIGAERALTSAHVVDLRPFEGSVDLFPYRWQSKGVSGVTSGGAVSLSADLAEIRPNRPFPVVYGVAKNPPSPGDRVWIQGYDFRKGKDAYGPRIWEVKVLRVIAGHIIMDRAADEGTSGSCVFNASGEVVGILNWGVRVHNGDEVGVAAGIWGSFLPRSPLEGR